MRMIGRIEDKSLARTFGDYLTAQGIENEIDAEDSAWSVWVHSEDQVETAKAHFERYLKDPQAPEFQSAAAHARAAEEKRARPKGEIIYVARRWNLGRYERLGYLTFCLIAACLVVAFATNLGAKREALSNLHITKYEEITEPSTRRTIIRWHADLPEVRGGEIWRLFTPMFIHFGLIHLLFNMFWLRDLGSMIERRQGVWLLAAQVLVISACSNLAQYVASGPTFGGMSGVVYGLLGYIWVRGKLDPASSVFLNKTTVVWMMVWFFVCLFGIVPHVANAAHAAGLGIGMAWGYLSSGHLKRLFRSKVDMDNR